MDQVMGRYEVTGPIGAGAFGTVFAGRDPETGARVAIKRIDRAGTADAETRRQLHREAAALTAVRSPYCLQVLDVIDEPDLLAMVTDYVPGAPLSTLLAARGRLSGPEALQVVWGAASGLAAVHAASLVHGDVKPANVLLDPQGSSRLIDFGLADAPGWLHGDEPSTYGSPAYSSPEQLAHGYRDARSDLYSLGVTLYELVCGRRPFLGPTLADVVHQHTSEPVPDPRLHAADLGDELARVIVWPLMKDPAQRPQDVAAFLSYLAPAASRQYGSDWLRDGVLGGAVGVLLGTGALASGALVAGATGLASASSAGVAAMGGSTFGGAGASGSSAAPSAAATGATKAGALATVGAKVAAVATVGALVVGGATVATVEHHHRHSTAAATPTQQVLAAYTTDGRGGGAFLVGTDGSTMPVAAMTLSSEFQPIAVAASPGGRSVAAANGKAITIASTLDPTRQQTIDCACTGVAFAPDGRLVSLSGDDVEVYELSAGRAQLAQSLPTPHPPNAEYSSSDGLLAVDAGHVYIVQGSRLQAVDLGTGTVTTLIRDYYLAPDDASVSGDGRYLAIDGWLGDEGGNGVVDVFDLQASLAHGAAIHAVQYAGPRPQNGRVSFDAADHLVEMWAQQSEDDSVPSHAFGWHRYTLSLPSVLPAWSHGTSSWDDSVPSWRDLGSASGAWQSATFDGRAMSLHQEKGFRESLWLGSSQLATNVRRIAVVPQLPSPAPSSPPASSSTPSPTAALTATAQLANARIPAINGCRTMRLHDFVGRDADGGIASLDHSHVVFGDFTGDGVSDAIAPVVCTPGAAPWPYSLVLFSSHADAVSTTSLGAASGEPEQAWVTSMEANSDGTVAIRWSARDGGCWDASSYAGTAAWTGSRLSLTTAGPSRIDYRTAGCDENRSWADGWVDSTADVQRALGNAPNDFKTFIAERWSKTAAPFMRTGQMAMCSPNVSVDRYMSSGFAYGAEGGCGGVRAVWARVGSSWRRIAAWNGEVSCAVLRRYAVPAWVMEGESCMDGSDYVPYAG